MDNTDEEAFQKVRDLMGEFFPNFAFVVVTRDDGEDWQDA